MYPADVKIPRNYVVVKGSEQSLETLVIAPRDKAYYKATYYPIDKALIDIKYRLEVLKRDCWKGGTTPKTIGNLEKALKLLVAGEKLGKKYCFIHRMTYQVVF